MAQTNGSEQVVTIRGQEYRFSRFELPLVMRFFSWSKSVLPNPYEAIVDVIKKFPENIQLKMVERAEKKADLRGSLQDPDAIALMASPEGLRYIFWLLLQKHHPRVTQD